MKRKLFLDYCDQFKKYIDYIHWPIINKLKLSLDKTPHPLNFEIVNHVYLMFDNLYLNILH